MLVKRLIIIVMIVGMALPSLSLAAETAKQPTIPKENAPQQMIAGGAMPTLPTTGFPVVDNMFREALFYVEHPGQFLQPLIPYLHGGAQGAITAHESMLRFMNRACGATMGTISGLCFGHQNPPKSAASSTQIQGKNHE